MSVFKIPIEIDDNGEFIDFPMDQWSTLNDVRRAVQIHKGMKDYTCVRLKTESGLEFPSYDTKIASLSDPEKMYIKASYIFDQYDSSHS